MIQVTTSEAQQQLPHLLAEAQAGKGVEIRAEDGQTFRLVPNQPSQPIFGIPKAGRYKGLIHMAPDFDASLEELREYME